MQITHMTLAKVAYDATSAPLELREVDQGVNAFLRDHIKGLREMTSKRRTPPGKFTDPEAQNFFRDLFTGTDDAFLTPPVASPSALPPRWTPGRQKDY